MFVKAALPEGRIPFVVKSQKLNSKVEKAIQEADEIEDGHINPKPFKIPSLFLKMLINNESF